MKRKYKPNKAKAGTKNHRRCPQCGKMFLPKDRRTVKTNCTMCGAVASKPRTISQLKAEAWLLFSKIVRRSGADKHGLCKCVTCGIVKPWREMQAGHAIKSRAKGILFDRRIVRPQCPICNHTELHNDEYLLAIVEELGRETVDEILRAKWAGGTWTKDELCGLIEQFDRELAELKLSQNF